MLFRGLIVIAVVLAAAQLPSERTPIFGCGEDQKLGAEIPLHWTNIVLAGDSRGYVPCPAVPPLHTVDHRESLEADVISRGSRSKDP